MKMQNLRQERKKLNRISNVDLRNLEIVEIVLYNEKFEEYTEKCNSYQKAWIYLIIKYILYQVNKKRRNNAEIHKPENSW
ncbi:unnamed protein product [Blepharisma stoltei]|uniref:Uncharacterized protein n=1 Tax=Blepharisma stoltei TaxID=1481888 RepID=A0AAU9I7G2_9CILI|nr:unnamed protein product [Blepharisma stoltei]